MKKKHSLKVRWRTFTHLLLRPGYMIRDYINGAHERYLAR
ncbi:MAG: DUF3667 domain-containing protein [Bacteroidales bacterium]|nr:DUF3667 domain-containing protein [Bacteroidales bacterium]